jgi:hypothetical protein
VDRKKLIAELEKDTGLRLKYNAQTGNLEVVGDPTKASGGSAIFRKDLAHAIGSKDIFNVINYPKQNAYDPKTRTTHLDFSFNNPALTLGIVSTMNSSGTVCMAMAIRRIWRTRQRFGNNYRPFCFSARTKGGRGA